MAAWIKMPLGMKVGLGLGPGDFVLDGDPAPPSPNSSHVYCGQTAGWIKMVLGMEVGLSSGDFCYMETQPLPNSWPISTEAKRLDASRYHLVWR